MEKSILTEMKDELKQHQEKNEQELATLRMDTMVQKYIKAYSTQQRLLKNELILNSYEEGYDGTIFGPNITIVDQNYNNKFYGLGKILGLIIELKMSHGCGNTTDFEEIKAYSTHAAIILQDMKHYDGDPLETEYLGLDVYENPRQYQFANFERIEQTLTEEAWKRDYQASQYIDYNEVSKQFKLKKVFPSIIDSEQVNDRQFQAFYNETACQMLGIPSLSPIIEKKFLKEVKR